ncbi:MULTISPECIES: MupA/Atu3671 family FMN-dependent luciferase-like monooxygenase [unclassified Microbacterium]|uniref:MupA/Atu3671 family FMN-dependent luciferase-like monooxygenase n=1 Tax=unclassified Microbacterium TaxID=2609290 RepID=UPI000CFD0514|nr:LLM class flavin-dependent oxidoreductase [Microbacterium sp. MYb43]PQZ73255.1 LLM class flavin-dependent oxidoreductase [Microbacterium sp. MYb40]PRB18725.1 LLM class flavin-dependent oxidoreductase [Microbacterium sp. MYb54]PRB24382.1 LLM class flavin-dependent oxidoreductase [Microbacterium sp. MYb50]PRB64430.1 LLM class flavin-dependent oxidoreductase [Microbacterium sp. MYb32]PRB67246.1 LLM class flavin-dependent oxidoreductase [Microbacterium sp. MYb24]
MDISLFYFGGQTSGGNDQATPEPTSYRLLIEGSRLADKIGLSAIWTPERHFHAFGASYADPAVTSSAISMITTRVAIRAGSVVMPLHDPVRLVEQWAMIDNLSGGRVGISFASGWHPRDFALAHRQNRYDSRKQDLEPMIELVRSLWRGETVRRESGTGELVDIQVVPRPLQIDLPTWITSAGSRDTFELAGRLGANVLTHLLGQSREQLAGNIAVYRQALEIHHPGSPGHVTLMMHTYLSHSVHEATEAVRKPLSSYLATALDLEQSSMLSASTPRISHSDRDFLLSRAVDRFVAEDGLIGTLESTRSRVTKFAGIGVDEIACLVDFGVDEDLVLEGLTRLGDLQ